MKTLSQIEPRTAITNLPFNISRSGSFYLAGHLSGVAGSNGITIGSSDVSIDLMGFTLRGVPGSHSGIDVSGPRSNIIVRNGFITEWDRHGLNLQTALPGSQGVLVEDVVVFANASNGIAVVENSIVRHCVAYDNGQFGIMVSMHSLVEGCVARENGYGILTGAGSIVRLCSVRGNQGYGIAAGASSLIEGNTCTLNLEHGLYVESDCLVRGNVSNNNGNHPGSGAGLYTDSYGNRIQENTFHDNDWGLRVVGTGNWIAGNMCTGNATNYQLAANNRYGQIVDLSAPGGGAVSGNSGTNSIMSTNPWANFAF